MHALLRKNSRRRVSTSELARHSANGGYQLARKVRDVSDDLTRAELLLRVGSLTGFLASAAQVSGEHELAKELIVRSVTIFEQFNEDGKTAEAHGEIALCYWREGAYDEARVHLAEGLSLSAKADADIKAVLLIRSAIVAETSQRLHEGLRCLQEAAPLVEQSHDHALKGSFHTEFGLVLRKLASHENREDYLDRALIEYSAASFHLEQADSKRYVARVENNLGFLYLTVGRYSEARAHLDRARAIFEDLADIGNIAQVDDSRARLLLAEGLYAESEKSPALWSGDLKRAVRMHSWEKP